MADNYYLELDQFVRSVEISQNDSYSLLLGAGASITSGIPSAADCIWEWKKNIYTSKTGRNTKPLDIKSEQVRNQVQDWLNSEGAYPALDDPCEYSFYVEQCYPIEDDRRKFFQRITERKKPSVGYKLVNLLHRAGIVKSIWTTNFDDLCRDAGVFTNNVVVDISLDTVDRIVRPQNDQELLLIKLHGDYKNGPLKNTDDELKTQDTLFRCKLVDYLNDKHLIVAGYSGRDDSVMDALIESYSKPGAGRLFWCGYGRSIPTKVLALLKAARDSGRTAYFIPTDGFDSLFISLAAACTQSDTTLSALFRDYIKAVDTGDTKTKFTITVPKVNAIIKSNLFKILFPQEVFQFKITYNEGEKPWQTLREMTTGKNVVAVPFQKMVWTLGTLADINNIFSERLQGKISRVPIADINIYKDTAIYSLLLTGITQLLAQRHGLHCDNRNLIWRDKSDMNRIINDRIYFTHKAIRLSITSDSRNNYLSLTPSFHITDETDNEKIAKEIYQEVGRIYFEKIWNKPYNDYVDEWRKLFLKSDTTVVELEYPLNSSSGFIFKIQRSPGFAAMYNASLNSLVVSEKFPQGLIIYKGIKYPEPQLVFSSKYTNMTVVPRDFHPMRGVSSNKPYDHNLAGTTSDAAINLGIICPQTDSAKFSPFIKKQLSKVEYTGKNDAYIISYPGFYEAFSTSLNIPDPGDNNWSYCPEPAQTQTIKDVARDLRNHIIRCIDQLTADAVKKVIVIYIPNRWLNFTSYDSDNEHYDLHDFIKAYCAERGIATQFIQEDTISNPLQCQINWWLSLSYYVKSMRTPWVLDSLDKSTAFAGIGYSVTNQDGTTDIVLGCSHIYNSQGRGLKYRLSKMQDKLFWDRQKRPHLSYKDAYQLGVSTIGLFYNTMNEFPKRVVVHKRTYFTQDEINGLKDSLLSGGVTELDLIEINFEDDIRFVASKLNQAGMPEIDLFAVPRGSCILLNAYEALLWTHGVVPSVKNPHFKFYLGGRYIPGPLRIRKHYGKSNIGLIATEILGLTKMNWNSFDLYSQLPATVNSSNEIARIGKLLSKKEGITYDYRYFI